MQLRRLGALALSLALVAGMAPAVRALPSLPSGLTAEAAAAYYEVLMFNACEAAAIVELGESRTSVLRTVTGVYDDYYRKGVTKDRLWLYQNGKTECIRESSIDEGSNAMVLESGIASAGGENYFVELWDHYASGGIDQTYTVYQLQPGGFVPRYFTRQSDRLHGTVYRSDSGELTEEEFKQQVETYFGSADRGLSDCPKVSAIVIDSNAGGEDFADETGKIDPYHFENNGWTDFRVSDLKAVLMRKAMEGADAGTVLKAVNYLGDRDRCRMSAAMAEAYAEVLEGMEDYRYSSSHSDYGDYWREDFRYAVLLDPAQTGLPLLATMYLSPQKTGQRSEPLYMVYDCELTVWGFDGREAIPYEVASDALEALPRDSGGWISEFSAEQVDGEIMLCVESLNGTSYGTDLRAIYYRIADATLEQAHTYATRYMDRPPESWDGVDGAALPERENVQTYFNAQDNAFAEIPGMTVSRAMAAALRAYSGSGYRFQRANPQTDSNARPASQAAAEATGGALDNIFRLADGLYYAIVDVRGVQKGVLVRAVRQNGELLWLTVTDDRLRTQDELDATATEARERSNLAVDFSAIRDMDLEGVRQYILQLMNNMEGVSLNDPAKQQMAELIENAVAMLCGEKVSGKDGSLRLDGEDTAELAAHARSVRDELLALVGEPLNRPVATRLRLLWKDCGFPCQVVLDRKLLDALSDTALQLLINDGQHCLQVSPEALRAIVEEYGSLTIRMGRTEGGVYSINLLSADEAVLERIETPVTLSLPCDSPTGTVMVSYWNGSDNWGGQYDENAGAIFFDARWSGSYEVLENSATISDIVDLPKESQNAIRFLVSKGFMRLDGQRFRPEEPLSRYDFTQALVGLFFALDRSLECTFPDVARDSDYYSYVASGQKEHLLKGYGGRVFGGDRPITVEQMLTLAGRTLVERKGYTTPEDPSRYLAYFSDGEAVSDWAQEQAALAIREGLTRQGGALHPKADVSREEAAVILYRLFQLLHEVSPVELELPGENQRSLLPVILCLSGGTALTAAGILLLLKTRRKEETEAEDEEDEEDFFYNGRRY